MLTLLPLFSWTMGFLVAGRAAPRVPNWAFWLLFAATPPLVTCLVFGRRR